MLSSRSRDFAWWSYAGTNSAIWPGATHHLVRVDEDFQVNLQRVDLLNYDAPMDYVVQSWV